VSGDRKSALRTDAHPWLSLTRRRSSWIDLRPPAPEGGGGISKNCWPRWPPRSQSLIGYPWFGYI